MKYKVWTVNTREWRTEEIQTYFFKTREEAYKFNNKKNVFNDHVWEHILTFDDGGNLMHYESEPGYKFKKDENTCSFCELSYVQCSCLG
jgi:hypothetical protein